MKISDLAIIEPDDILLVDFGKSTIRCRVQGKHPAFVVYVSDRRKTDSQMLVIPMFRSQSKGNEDMDIRDAEVAGSNPVTSITNYQREFGIFRVLYFFTCVSKYHL